MKHLLVGEDGLGVVGLHDALLVLMFQAGSKCVFLVCSLYFCYVTWFCLPEFAVSVGDNSSKLYLCIFDSHTKLLRLCGCVMMKITIVCRWLESSFPFKLCMVITTLALHSCPKSTSWQLAHCSGALQMQKTVTHSMVLVYPLTFELCTVYMDTVTHTLVCMTSGAVKFSWDNCWWCTGGL